MPKNNKIVFNIEDLHKIRDLALTLIKEFPSYYSNLPEFQGRGVIQTYCYSLATSIYLKNQGIIEKDLTYIPQRTILNR